MGMLQIKAWGSFRQVDKTFTAQTSGHTVAVDDAIQLLQELKRVAQAQDLDLREAGHAPDDGFAEADKRQLL